MRGLVIVASLVIVPLLGALAARLAALAGSKPARLTALVATLATAALAVLAASDVQSAGGHVIGVALGRGGLSSLVAARLDGLSLPLVVLTAGLGVVAVLASWRIEDRPGTFLGLLLALQAAVTLVFVADDLVLFYVAWEAVLIPMFFLIGQWGHEDRRHAAMKFFLYTFAGSALMLVGIIVLAVTFSSTSISGILSTLKLAEGLDAAQRSVLATAFWLLAIGFAVKVPIWPLHSWLPDAHVEAPTAGSIMLAGVLLKMGGYGFLRLGIAVSPEAYHAAAPYLAALGIAGVVYGALMALAQDDLKRLVAYSSVSHMGFLVLAIAVGTPLALAAAMLVMVAHGVVAALLFLLVGSLQERTHTREISRFGGLLAATPAWGWLFVFGSLASLGLPGLAGFPGEFATFVEGFRALSWWMLAAAFGIVIAGAYNLRAVRRVAHGPLASEWEGLADLSAAEALAAAPLAVAVVVLGVAPTLVTSLASPLLASAAGLLGRL